MSLPLRRGLDNVNSIERIVEDLLVRFVINCPPEDLSSVERELFHFEEASWFYTDFIRLINPNLPSLKIKQLSQLFIRLCPVIWKWDNVQVDEALLKFSRYKKTIPVRGAAIFNENLNKILLVKGTESDSWSFPRGKISKDEDDVACCIREVKEEIGFDLTDYINDYQFIERNIGGKNYKIYLVKGVSEDTVFKPQARNEIEKIQWFDFRKIAKLMFKNGNSGNCGSLKFYLINSMMKPLSLWLKHERNIKNEDQLRAYAEEQLKLLLGITKEEALDPGRELLNLLHSSVQKQPKVRSMPSSKVDKPSIQVQDGLKIPPSYQNSIQNQQSILPQIQTNTTFFGFRPFSPALFSGPNKQINVFAENNMVSQPFVPPPIMAVTPQPSIASPLAITSPPQQVALLKSPEMVVRSFNSTKQMEPGAKVRLLQRGQPLGPTDSAKLADPNSDNISGSKALLNLLHSGAQKMSSRKGNIVGEAEISPYVSTDNPVTSTLPTPSFTSRTASNDLTMKPGSESVSAVVPKNGFGDYMAREAIDTKFDSNPDYNSEENDKSSDNGVYYSDFEASTDSEVEEQLEEELGELEMVSPIPDTEYVNTKDLMRENNFKKDEIPHKDDETDTVKSVLSDPSVSMRVRKGNSQENAFPPKSGHVPNPPASDKQLSSQQKEKPKKFRILRRGETIETLNKEISAEPASKPVSKDHTKDDTNPQEIDTKPSTKPVDHTFPDAQHEDSESILPVNEGATAPNLLEDNSNAGGRLLSLLKKNAKNSAEKAPSDVPAGKQYKSPEVNGSDLLQMLKGPTSIPENNASPDLKSTLQSRAQDYQSPLLEQGSGPMQPTLGGTFGGIFDINTQPNASMVASYSLNQPVSGFPLQNNSLDNPTMHGSSSPLSNTFHTSPPPPVIPSNGGNVVLNMIKNPLQPPNQSVTDSGFSANSRQVQDVSASNDLLNMLHKKRPQNMFSPNMGSNNSPLFGSGSKIQGSQLLSFLNDEK